jgi:two-component system nitrate/nitrite response regulator NarL
VSSLPLIRVLIVAGIRLYRDGLAEVLSRRERLQVVGTAATRVQAMSLLTPVRPDVVLLDMATPDSHAAARELAVAEQLHVVALGVPENDEDAIACAEAGVAGYVFRDASVDDLVGVIESAARGELLCSPRVAGWLARRVAILGTRRQDALDERLTAREREILTLIDRGLANKEIAVRLHLGVATVKVHVHNVLEKLQVHTRAEAAARLRHG